MAQGKRPKQRNSFLYGLRCCGVNPAAAIQEMSISQVYLILMNSLSSNSIHVSQPELPASPYASEDILKFTWCNLALVYIVPKCLFLYLRNGSSDIDSPEAASLVLFHFSHEV